MFMLKLLSLRKNASKLNNILCKNVSTKNEPLTDSFNRKHNYLRISLTEKCNLRCE